jgi:hypothetical protein
VYAAGNNTASETGHTDSGHHLAPGGVFGFSGALHAAQPARHPTFVEAVHQ